MYIEFTHLLKIKKSLIVIIEKNYQSGALLFIYV